ncbi:MAG: DUF2255 family protein, partial [Syntrophomonadaceae bacterium]
MKKPARSSSASGPAKARRRAGAASRARRPRFPRPVVEEFAVAKMIGVRSGAQHRFTGIWVVVVGARVFVRSWNDGAGGWREAFRAQPRGEARCGDREIAVLLSAVRGARLLDA